MKPGESKRTKNLITYAIMATQAETVVGSYAGTTLARKGDTLWLSSGDWAPTWQRNPPEATEWHSPIDVIRALAFGACCWYDKPDMGSLQIIELRRTRETEATNITAEHLHHIRSILGDKNSSN